MMPRTVFSTMCLMGALVVVSTGPAVSQEHHAQQEAEAGHEQSADHSYHPNHFGGTLGVSVHLDNDDAGLAIGLEYARQFSPRWAVGGYVDIASSEIERDAIVAAGLIFYPTRRIGLVVAPGLELATKDVEHGGEVDRESEAEILIRMGASFGFPLTETATLGPVVLFDLVGDRWTVVGALGMVVGF